VARKTLIDRFLKSLKPNAKLADQLGHYDIWDTIVPGLGVRVSAAGCKTFTLTTRYPGSSNPTRRSLGAYGALTLEQARKKHVIGKFRWRMNRNLARWWILKPSF